MPEGDTLHRTAAGLRPYLVGRVVRAAGARQPGPRTELLVGARIEAVDTLGKNLLIRFDHGLELRTHLGLHGSWHRYRPGEPWRRPASRARLTLEVDGAIAVCFDAPTVELLERRAEGLHRPLATLGPDLMAPDLDEAEILRRARDPARASTSIGAVLLDQRVAAGIGNVYRSELLFLAGLHPSVTVEALDDETLLGLVRTARRLLIENADRARPVRITVPRGIPAGVAGSRSRGFWVYRRAGRPCRRCGTPTAVRREGSPPRAVYWCPECQRPPAVIGQRMIADHV